MLCLLGHDPLDQLLHPWSLGVEADPLARWFQCGTATPNHKQSNGQMRRISRWQPEHLRALTPLVTVLKRGLTWFLYPRSESWGKPAPPSRCAGRWVCSPSWCSGSAVPPWGPVLSGHRKSHVVTKCNSVCSHTFQERTGMLCTQRNDSSVANQQKNLTFIHVEGRQEQCDSNDNDPAARHFVQILQQINCYKIRKALREALCEGTSSGLKVGHKLLCSSSLSLFLLLYFSSSWLCCLVTLLPVAVDGPFISVACTWVTQAQSHCASWDSTA